MMSESITGLYPRPKLDYWPAAALPLNLPFILIHKINIIYGV